MGYHTELYNKRKEAGLCVKCGKPNDTSGVKCVYCKSKAKQNWDDHKDAYTSIVNKRKAQLLESGRCVRCRKHRDQSDKTLCNVCLEEQNVYAATYRAENRDILNETHKERYHKLKEEGLCPECHKPSKDGFVYCSDCRIDRADEKRKLENERRASNLCVTCGDSLNGVDTFDCENCREKRVNRYHKRIAIGFCPCGRFNDSENIFCCICRERNNKWFKERRAFLLAEGKCFCGSELSEEKATCLGCTLYKSERHTKLKLEVFRHYSSEIPKCSCCGESIFEFLTLEHIGGTGHFHRKQLGENASADDIYRDLKKRGFPPGHAVLCWNCNTGTFNNGVCPHKEFVPYTDTRYFELKLKLIEHYGPCFCCNEKRIRFLSIDHVDGGGRKHRRVLGSGRALYEHIVENNFPNDFRIACLNCNCGRTLNGGICPHQYNEVFSEVTKLRTND